MAVNAEPEGAGDSPVGVRPSLRQAFGSLSEPVFRRWFVSQALSASGTMTQSVGQSWLVLKLTGSGVDLGLLTACFFAPVLLGGPWAGALVDRVDRRRLLIVTQSLFLALACLLAALTATHAVRVWMLFLIAAATGAVGAPDSAARQVFAFDLVGTQRLASAVSLNEVVLNTSRVLGPAAGGALLATLGVAACFVLNAASYLPPLVVLAMHKGTGRAPSQPTTARGRKGKRPGQLRLALGYAWRNPTIRACLFLAAASGMLFNLNVPLPLLATRTFHLGGGGYGLLMAAFGVGALPGAVLAAAGTGRPRGRSVAALALVTSVLVLATACAPDAALGFAGMAATGCFSIWFIARANTLVQLESEASMRGRVMGVWNMALPGCEPITSPFVGWVAESAGAREGFGLAGVALILAAASGWSALSRGQGQRLTESPASA
jgi:MFS family permease